MTPTEAYNKAEELGWSQELEDVVANARNPYYAYLFAYNILGSNINRLQQVVIDSESPEWAYRFAVDVKGSNIDRLQQVVIDAGEPYCALDFARFVPGANISDLVDFVLMKKPELIKFLFDERPDLKQRYLEGK